MVTKTFIISIIVSILFFLLIREVILWYYKINDRIKNQEKIIKLLEESKDLQQKQLRFHTGETEVEVPDEEKLKEFIGNLEKKEEKPKDDKETPWRYR